MIKLMLFLAEKKIETLSILLADVYIKTATQLFEEN